MPELVVRKVGKSELGRRDGECSFAKVNFAQKTETSESVAMKTVDRGSIIKRKVVDQVLLSSISLSLFLTTLFI